jgi:hypothetical protein
LACGQHNKYNFRKPFEDARKLFEGLFYWRRVMKNEVLERIKAFAIKELQNAYGYCGCASGDNSAMLNSDDKNGFDISIVIKAEAE